MSRSPDAAPSEGEGAEAPEQGASPSRSIRVLLVLHVVFLLGVPIFDEVRREPGRFSWSRHAAHLAPTTEELRSLEGPSAVLGLLPDPSELRALELELEQASDLRRRGLALVQPALVDRLGLGGVDVVRGEGDWLFYEPSVHFEVGADVDASARRRFEEIAGRCAERGIALLVAPIPSKARICRERCVRGPAVWGGGAILDRSPAVARWVRGLRAEGIEVVELERRLRELDGGASAFLHTDTHWSPRGMEVASDVLVDSVWPRLRDGVVSRRFTTRSLVVRNHGDLVRLLALPEGQTVVAPERASVDVVQDEDGVPVGPDRRSRVLLVGDSFSNIYSRGDLGWGTAAGLAEHLALRLREPVDRIARNGGVRAALRELERGLAASDPRLSRTRVVVVAFAVRELGRSGW